MATRANIRPYRGTCSSMPTLNPGEVAACTDTRVFYIGTTTGNVAMDGGGSGGTVTSVGLSLPGASFITITGSPVTSSGTLTGTWTGTLGDTLYCSAVDTWSKLAGNTTTTRKFLRQTGNGTISAAPAWDTLQTSDVPNLSGTNTGDQTITLTGDVSGSGTGSFVTTIGNDVVTYAKMQNVSAASKLIGRGADAGAGDPQEITLGTGLSMSGTTLNATGSGTVTSVGFANPGLSTSLVTITNSPVTGSGTLTQTWNGLYGEILYCNGSGAWDRLSRNTTTTRKFLTELGDGAAVSTIGWDTLVAGDIPGTLNATTVLLADAATTTAELVITIGHNTSGTAAAGFGSISQWQLQTSTTADVDAANLTVTWATATHASRKARVTLNVYDTAAREFLRGEASGTAALIGFLGAAAAARQTGDAGTALVTFGLMSGTPTFAGANVTGTVPLATTAGTCTGNAATVTTNANLTGPITSVGNATTIAEPTLAAFAALTIAANSLTIGTGADAFAQTTFAANTFPARASAGDLVAKTITDFGLSLVDDADAAEARTTLGALASAVPAVKVTNSGDSTITTATKTIVSWDTEDYDTATMHSTASNTSRLTAPSAGKYLLECNLRYTPPAGSTGSVHVGWRLNGASASDKNIAAFPISSTATLLMVNAAIPVHLAASDYIEFWAFQSSGGNMTLTAADSFAAMTRLGD